MAGYAFQLFRNGVGISPRPRLFALTQLLPHAIKDRGETFDLTSGQVFLILGIVPGCVSSILKFLPDFALYVVEILTNFAFYAIPILSRSVANAI
ncbi:hypothetical protein [Pelagibacterium luteolum]|uniref:hypothetical protein n=1 Tax=Pelagibacterium luteolum TaxID=440168 RepID=UPI000B88371B|nr:hypothetical protein [Pelagibacterium luteolum]